MFIGFIPFLAAGGAALLSLRDERKARIAWAAAAVLGTTWTVFHGTHHYAELSTFGSW